MTTPEDVLQLFEQLYQAEQQLAANTERERLAIGVAQAARADREEAERQVTALRERMQKLARRAAGVPEPDPPGGVDPLGMYRPIRRGGL